MASSQVEIVSSPPFGCVLRDHNRRDEFRESKWRKFMVKDRLNAFISITSDENENSWLPNTLQLTGNDNDRDGFSPAMIPKETVRAATTETTEREPQEESSASPPDCEATTNLGAASLVQIWEKRLKQSNAGENQESTALSSGENAVSSALETEETEEDSVLDEERFDSLPDWQSDRTEPSLGQSLGSEAGESERVRVADIIKRLTGANQVAAQNSGEGERDREQSGSSGSPSATAASDQPEQQRSLFQPVLISPRIRGRQAFADLLLQMERERLGELNALIDRRPVSRFPQRGRIQAMLRLRSLERGLALQDRHRLRSTSSSSSSSSSSSASSQAERLKQGSSSITHLRERFSTKIEPNVTSRSGEADIPRSTNSEITNITKVEKLENSSSSNVDEEKQNHEVISIQQRDATVLHDFSERITEDRHEELGPSTSLTCQGTSSKGKNLDPQETSLEQRNLDPQELSTELRSLGLQKTSSESRSLAPQETSLVDRNLGSQEAVDTTEATTSFGCWDGNDAAEELEDNYLQYEEEETGYDWISSHPRSYWEDRRQEWYYEMLDSNSKNAEIRHLLERGTVTGFLASEFRERMDRLMTTRLEIQTHLSQSQGEEEEDDQVHLISLIQNSHERQQEEEEEEPKEEIEDEEEEQEQQEEEEQHEEQEEESLISGQFHEASDYFNQSTSSLQIPSPSLLRTWIFQDNEVGNDIDSDRAASTSPHQDNFPSQSYYQNAPQCSSSVTHPSIEMELICELRGQMEHLYREMSDLRKSLKSCMDMQMILMQRHMKHEIHSESSEAKNKSAYEGTVQRKGHCCICYEMKVDSLLYRCGHMCTCLKCAHELQWSSGKCPICCAAIVDVVRAYLDS